MTWLHPDPARVETNVLAHEGQSESCALGRAALARSGTARESLEDSLSVGGGDALATVFDDDPHVRCRVLGRADVYGDRAATMCACIVDEVGHHPSQSPTVAMNADVRAAFVDTYRRSGHAAGEHRLPNELTNLQFIASQTHGTGVVAGDLQQILDQTAEAGYVGDQQIECRLATLGQFVTPRHHDFHGCGQRHEG